MQVAIERKINFEVISMKIQSCSSYREIYTVENRSLLSSYVEDLFLELRSRIEGKGSEERYISNQIFSEFIQLPLVISDRLFNAFNRGARKDMLSCKDFCEGIEGLYFGDLDKLLDLTFHIFTFTDCNKINKGDVQIILTILNNGEMLADNIKEIVNDFFQTKRTLSFQEYRERMEDDESSIFILLLIFLYRNKPFSEEELRFYREIKNIKKNEKSKNFLSSKLKSFTFRDDKISRPSGEIMSFLKINFSNFLSGVKRKYAKKNLFKFENFVEKNEELNFLEENINSEKISSTSTYSTSCVSSPSSPKIDSASRTTGNETLFKEMKVLRLSQNKKLIEYKLILLEKKLFIFKNERGIKFELEEIKSLNGYFPTECDASNILGHSLYPFALMSQYGGEMTKLNNFFFCRSKEQMTSCLNKIQKALNHIDFYELYSIQDELGEGHFGKVKLAVNKNTGEKVAIKIIHKKNLKTKKEVQMVKNEIEVMKYLRNSENSHIVQMIEVLEDRNKIYIVMEYMAGGSLSAYLRRRTSILKEEEIWNIARQISSALKHFAENGIIHRDLKHENILIKQSTNSGVKAYDLCLKISDYGFAKVVGEEENSTEGYGTLIYTAPEILLKKSYDKKVDVWSFGVLLYNLVSGLFPFDLDSSDKSEEPLKEIANKIVKDNVLFNSSNFDNSSNELLKLIHKCLIKDPTGRINISQAYEDIVN